MSFKAGTYTTLAGSVVSISGAHAGIVEVSFDWLEEGACVECVVDPYPSDGRLTWSCAECGGGSASLAPIPTQISPTMSSDIVR